MVERGTAKKIFSSSCTWQWRAFEIGLPQAASVTLAMDRLLPFWEFRIQCTWLRCW